MRQYKKIKEQNSDSIVLYRLGDFYEMYFDDAFVASKELDLKITEKNCGAGQKAPQCGVPYHSCEAYVQRLVDKGYKVAICEQSDEKENGIQKREIVRLITRGTVIDSVSLKEGENNFLCAVCSGGFSCGVCFVDITTGKLFLTEFSSGDFERRLIEETGRMSPSEIIINKETLSLERFIGFCGRRFKIDPCLYEDVGPDEAADVITAQFGKDMFGDSGLEKDSRAAEALSAALIYIKKAYSSALSMINSAELYANERFLEIDGLSQRNLNVTENTFREDATLLNILDNTKTPMGARMIKQLLLRPLTNRARINARLEAVDYLAQNGTVRLDLADRLDRICDMERTVSRILCSRLNVRDLLKMKDSFAELPHIVSLMKKSGSSLLRECADGIDDLCDLRRLIAESIDESSGTDDCITHIREGYDSEIDFMRGRIVLARQNIKDIENTELARGIKGLKFRFSKTLGYYLETPYPLPSGIPDSYLQSQVLTGCARFVTDRLQKAQFELEHTAEAIGELEAAVLEKIKEQFGLCLMRLQKTSQFVALIDVLNSLAVAAKKNNYVKPVISDCGRLLIKNGRHPIVELLGQEMFVPNDLLMDSGENRTVIITGPNMAGKSTFMRQNALIVIMAHMGGFVPADFAEIPLTDRIFTRIGASDSIAQGKSTFMTEMEECVDIIDSATPDSLILLDEIGRGTSTYDGMAIARAILEYCNSKEKLGAKTMLATHYHELCSLEESLDGVKNYSVTVDDSGRDLVFTRKIVRGRAKKSYGIRAAQMVGMREDIVRRANELLESRKNEE